MEEKGGGCDQNCQAVHTDWVSSQSGDYMGNIVIC